MVSTEEVTLELDLEWWVEFPDTLGGKQPWTSKNKAGRHTKARPVWELQENPCLGCRGREGGGGHHKGYDIDVKILEIRL